eukprot:Sspe_Gene.109611::Locus_89766_Transcript_1_1_Confidence_1.000_Length_1629::g.109611::m.109611/K10268/FBXL2_20; F-box and leucine-rich repeat protein 2/20
MSEAEPLISGEKRKSVTAISGRRRSSNHFQSSKPSRDRMKYMKLLAVASPDPSLEKKEKGQTGKRVVVGNTLVASTSNKPSTEKGGPAARCLRTKAVLLNVFGYVGLHQLFLGQSRDDEHNLFQPKKAEPVGSPRLVCRMWAQCAKELEVVDFRPLRYTATDAVLTKALRLFRSCKELYLSECRRVKFLAPSFTSAMRNLEVLNLVGCSSLSDATLSVITMETPKLRELFVPACGKLEKVPIHKPPEGSLIEILDISANQKITDSTVERLINDLPRLRDLFMSQVEKLQSPNIRSSTLELLNVDGCSELTFSNVVKIMEGCPNLKFVTMGENDLMLEEPVKGFPPFASIVELNIAGTFQNDDTINTALTGMPNLRLLDCSNSEFVKNPKFEHDNLEFLVANMCCELSETALETAAKEMPKLRHVAMNHCDALKRPKVTSTSLALLDLSNCVHLLSDQNREPWLNCPNLTELYLGHSTHVTDIELKALLPKLPKLQHLNLYQAVGVVSPDLRVCRE